MAPGCPARRRATGGFSRAGKDSVYRTRFIYRMPLMDARKVGEYIDQVGCESGSMPTSVFIDVSNDTNDSTATIEYKNHTAADSDLIIGAWRQISPHIQVERMHMISADQFDAVALSGRNGRALRRALAREVRELCVRGVGSKGVLDYLDECESVVIELKEFVQSQRAPV